MVWRIGPSPSPSRVLGASWAWHRRFVRNYGTLAKLPTDLLKKDNFHWNDTCWRGLCSTQRRSRCHPNLGITGFFTNFYCWNECLPFRRGYCPFIAKATIGFSDQGFASIQIGVIHLWKRALGNHFCRHQMAILLVWPTFCDQDGPSKSLSFY